jgi:hypothetical protein
MMSRFFNYNCIVSYVGGLNQESFGMALKDALGDGNKFMPMILNDISLNECNGIQFIKINLLYYIERGIFSDEEKAKYISDLKKLIRESIEKELKSQKLFFNFEDD